MVAVTVPVSLRIEPGSRMHRVLLSASVVAGVVFTLVYMIDGALTPGYNPVTQPISGLALGSNGWVQSANFVFFGAVGLVTAVGVHRSLAPGRGAGLATWLRMIGSAALIVVGCFTTDPAGVPATLHGTIHTVAAFVTLGSSVAFLAVVGVRCLIEPRWRAWAYLAWSFAALMAACLIAFIPELADEGPAGVLERLASAVPVAIAVPAVIRLLRGTGRMSSS
jgi:hypothetical protein